MANTKGGTRMTAGGFTAALIVAVLRAIGDQSPHAAQSAVGANEPHLAYSYSSIGGRAMIHAAGEIGLGEVDTFNAWTASLSAAQRASIRVGMTTLVLDSNGGRIGGARQIADWVKDNQIDTVVPNGATCASACVMIWGAGWHKTAGSASQIGVHGASADIASNDQRVAVEALGTLAMARALADEKAPATIVAAVTTTESSDMHWLTAAAAVEWGATILDKDGQPES